MSIAQCPPARRIAYRLYRSPFVMFGLIPTYLFVLHYRLPFGLMRSGIRPWLSTMGTNAAQCLLIRVLTQYICQPILLIECICNPEHSD